MDFSEQQRFTNPIILIVFAFSAIVAFIGMGVAAYQVYQAGENMLPFIWTLIFLLFTEGLVYYILFRSELETTVSREGFSFRYFPLVRKQTTIAYADIQSWSLRSNKNIADTVRTGIGYRRSPFIRRTSFMMGGKEFLELNTLNGKRFLFSTQDTYSLGVALRKYIAEKEI